MAYDTNQLKSLLKQANFEKARIKTSDSFSDFTSEVKMIQYLESIDYPGEGSFILLKDGAWVSWDVHTALLAYEWRWQLYKRPNW